jgi:hypothetical protein
VESQVEGDVPTLNVVLIGGAAGRIRFPIGSKIMVVAVVTIRIALGCAR